MVYSVICVLCVCACASQVGLTRRSLRNDEKCGKGKDPNLAAPHAAARLARSGRVVSHPGPEPPSRTVWVLLERRQYPLCRLGRCGSGPGWVGPDAAARPERHRPVKETRSPAAESHVGSSFSLVHKQPEGVNNKQTNTQIINLFDMMLWFKL